MSQWTPVTPRHPVTNGGVLRVCAVTGFLAPRHPVTPGGRGLSSSLTPKRARLPIFFLGTEFRLSLIPLSLKGLAGLWEGDGPPETYILSPGCQEPSPPPRKPVLLIASPTPSWSQG